MASTISAGTTTTTALVYSADTSGVLQLQTNGTTTAVTIDTNQNVGVGVTPSAWGSLFKVVQVGSLTAIRGSTATSGFSSNAYYDGTNFKYITSAVATDYYQNNGQHYWQIAASGTAGNTISFTQAMTLDASGNLTVGPSGAGSMAFIPAGNASGSPYSAAYSSSNSSSYTYHSMYYTGGSQYQFYVDWGGTVHARSITITSLSDQRLKTNIKDISTGLSQILALQPRNFDWLDGSKTNASGFIAQEFQQIFPNSVTNFKAGENGVEYLAMNHEELIPTLVKAIQELSAQVTTLQTQVTALESK